MIVSEFIEWLKTIPQEAKIMVLDHCNEHGYYMQGGSCTVTDFDNSVEWMSNNSPHDYIYGNHFELNSNAGKEYTLQLGVMNK